MVQLGQLLAVFVQLLGNHKILLIAKIAGWEFIEFFMRMAPITMPVFVAGLMTCVFVERFSIAGFGNQLPVSIRKIFNDFDEYEKQNTTAIHKAELLVEGLVAIFLVIALALHVAAVGLIGLSSHHSS